MKPLYDPKLSYWKHVIERIRSQIIPAALKQHIKQA